MLQVYGVFRSLELKCYKYFSSWCSICILQTVEMTPVMSKVEWDKGLCENCNLFSNFLLICLILFSLWPKRKFVYICMEFNRILQKLAHFIQYSCLHRIQNDSNIICFYVSCYKKFNSDKVSFVSSRRKKETHTQVQ